MFKVWQSATPTLLRPSTIAMTAARLKTALASPVPTVAAAMLLVAARTPMPVVAANRAVALLPPQTLNAGIPMKGVFTTACSPARVTATRTVPRVELGWCQLHCLGHCVARSYIYFPDTNNFVSHPMYVSVTSV